MYVNIDPNYDLQLTTKQFLDRKRTRKNCHASMQMKTQKYLTLNSNPTDADIVIKIPSGNIILAKHIQNNNLKGWKLTKVDSITVNQSPSQGIVFETKATDDSFHQTK